jgi:Ca-activated chloride channel family protein
LVPSVALSSHRSSSILSRLVVATFVSMIAIGIWPTTVLKAQDQDDEVLRFSTDLSVFPIRVRNRNRTTKPELTADDLQLTDPDHVTTSSYFSVGADHVALVFALDESGSLSQTISQQRDAAVALFERFGKNSRVAVMRFSDRPRIVVPFGTDSDAARVAFDLRARQNSETAIFDAASEALKMFGDLHRDPAERRIVILISDGLDNFSTARVASIVSSAQDANISFYMIQVPLFEPRDGHLAIRGPSKGFKELAERTGGKYFLTADVSTALLPSQHQDLSRIFTAIEEDLRSQYLVGFYVGEKGRDDRTHKISITIKSPGVEYSVARSGFARTHHFSIRLSPRKGTQ